MPVDTHFAGQVLGVDDGHAELLACRFQHDSRGPHGVRVVDEDTHRDGVRRGGMGFVPNYLPRVVGRTRNHRNIIAVGGISR